MRHRERKVKALSAGAVSQCASNEMIVAQGLTLSAYSVGLAARALAILPNVGRNRAATIDVPLATRPIRRSGSRHCYPLEVRPA